MLGIMTDTSPFNSRPHEEVDLTNFNIVRVICLSIHDLTRRSTSSSYIHRLPAQIFQFTTSRGGRPLQYSQAQSLRTFQFTTSRGGRQQISTIIVNIRIHYSLFCTNHSFLNLFSSKFSITFSLFISYIWCESLYIFCSLHIRTKKLTLQSHQSWALFQYAPLCFYTYLPDYKIADYPLPCL